MLTEAGATFRDYAARVFAEIDAARETILSAVALLSIATRLSSRNRPSIPLHVRDPAMQDTPERRSQAQSCCFHRPNKLRQGGRIDRTAEAKGAAAAPWQFDHSRAVLRVFRGIGLYGGHVDGNEQCTP